MTATDFKKGDKVRVLFDGPNGREMWVDTTMYIESTKTELVICQFTDGDGKHHTIGFEPQHLIHIAQA